jgi:hypothetical protein
MDPIAKTIRAIDAWRDDGAALPIGSTVTIRTSDSGPYDEVADSGRAPFVRHLLAAIGGDEHRLFRWRLEHKLVQALVLDHYAPGCVPPTRGLASFAAECANGDLRRALKRAFRSGFIIKRVLGDSSGDAGKSNATREALAAFAEKEVRRRIAPAKEQWLAQEMLHIEREYRVHSFDRQIIPDLTFHRYRADANVAGGINEFVQSILERLPEGIVSRSLFAWDIARDLDGRRFVVEVNLAGVHPVFRPGFQCSGHLQHETTGAWASAMLILHIEQCLGIKIVVEADREEPWPGWYMYAEVKEELRRVTGTG